LTLCLLSAGWRGACVGRDRSEWPCRTSDAVGVSGTCWQGHVHSEHLPVTNREAYDHPLSRHSHATGWAGFLR
jgi:hypothetical protein